MSQVGDTPIDTYVCDGLHKVERIWGDRVKITCYEMAPREEGADERRVPTVSVILPMAALPTHGLLELLRIMEGCGRLLVA